MKDKDADAFRAFATVHLPRLRRSAFLMCGDWHLADDLAQQAIIRVLGKWSGIDSDSPLGGYVTVTLTRLWLDEKRRRSRRPEVAYDVVPDLAGGTAEQPTSHDQLALALDDLSPRQRTALVLRYWEGLSVRETADAMSSTEGAVKNLVFTAIRALRASISHEGRR